MRRADRLFQIIQILRRGRGPHIADAIAGELETSKRTVYRDIATLIGQRVPIRGEAGVGYVLEDGFDLPPLMLTPDEIEACVLGAQWVAGIGDPALARAAADLQAKIMAAVPERLRPLLLDPAGGRASPTLERRSPDGLDLGQVRAGHPRRAQAAPALPRRGRGGDRAHGLAGGHRLHGLCADAGGLVRTQSRLPPLSRRPGDWRRSLPGRALS